MRIDPSPSSGIQNAENAGHTQNVDKTNVDERGQACAQGDEVELSGASNLISLSAGMVSASRAAKISSLTAQVQSGQYRVDAGQVAHALVQSMLGA
jgi:flagellar biosynthesis anti-sigma factor FlgM